ncbi:hypothetical protein TEQG_06579 [Trichophyton equinum CBS 127.97]|uniref:Uncharacterized protein n=1 Tax=Trichophyton equinum (strain ATCC MYA-4606 / CBS 127.97) TaxID=559882 RepID=F2PZY4_TRIEC|nr:hypothetical protein TEQG_06579 [Trichophyton equinum CBS 127.97]
MSDDSSSKPSAEPDVAAALPDSQECSAPTETVPSRPPTDSDPSDDHKPTESQEVSQDTETPTSLDQPTNVPGLGDTAADTENSELLALLESNTQAPQQDKLEASSVHVDDTEAVLQSTNLQGSQPNVPEVTLTEDTTSAGYGDSTQPITQSSDEQPSLLSRSNTAELLARDDIVSRTNSFPTVNSATSQTTSPHLRLGY